MILQRKCNYTVWNKGMNDILSFGKQANYLNNEPFVYDDDMNCHTLSISLHFSLFIGYIMNTNNLILLQYFNMNNSLRIVFIHCKVFQELKLFAMHARYSSKLKVLTFLVNRFLK